MRLIQLQQQEVRPVLAEPQLVPLEAAIEDAEHGEPVAKEENDG